LKIEKGNLKLIFIVGLKNKKDFVECEDRIFLLNKKVNKLYSPDILKFNESIFFSSIKMFSNFAFLQ